MTNATTSRPSEIPWLREFCGGVPFWDQDSIDNDPPEFSTCFMDTILVWAPCFYLWVTAPLFIVYMYKQQRKPALQVSKLSITKALFSVIALCMVILQIICQRIQGYGCNKGISLPTSSYWACAVKSLTLLMTIVLQQVQRLKGVKTSAVPFVFWLALMLCETMSLYNHAIRTNACPEENASILSRVTYYWLLPIMWKCYRNTFKASEFWDQTERLKSDSVGLQLEKMWQDEVNAPKQLIDVTHPVEYNDNIEETALGPLEPENVQCGMKDSPKPSLSKTLMRCYWLVWTEATLYMTLTFVFWFCQPIILRFIISIVEDKKTTSSKSSLWKGFVYSALLLLVCCIKAVLLHVCYHHMMTLGLRVKTALIGLIYKKALTMNKSGVKTASVGEIVNLMSVDCQRIQDAFRYSFFALLFFIALLFGCIQLWIIMGASSLGCLAVVTLISPIGCFLTSKQYNLQQRLLQLKGSRIKILNEVISGIKVLKMYAWETPFTKSIEAIRSSEIQCLWKYCCYTVTVICLNLHSAFMMHFAVVCMYVLSSNSHSLSAELAFTSLAIVNITRIPITFIPFVMSRVAQAYVSVNRIHEFLCTDDLVINQNTSNYSNDAAHVISLTNGSFKWNKDAEKATLNDINLQILPGELVAVVGSVGCGKSSLISACLGEMETVTGHVYTRGEIAYAPQEAWIQNMTLRDNILFGKQYKEKKYNKIIEACALLPDLQLLINGDLTEIGEKGANISGGQKQRVSLARAVYSNADVYLLDDPLSAVDSNVGRHLFEKVIGNKGVLKRKTRVLITHGVHWLPMVDRIIVLDDGRISEAGTYEELLSQKGAFAQFLRQCISNEHDDSEVLDMREDIITRMYETMSETGLTSEDDRSSSISRLAQRRRFTKTRSMWKSSSSHEQGRLLPLTELDLARLTTDETPQEGRNNMTVIFTYIKSMGLLAVTVALLSMCIFQGMNVFTNYMLTFWSEDNILKNTSLSGTPVFVEKNNYYLLMYLLCGVIQGIFMFLSFILALSKMTVASKRLHNSMLNSIIRSPLSFFDTTPIGRIMNRFTSDVDIMDNNLPDGYVVLSTWSFYATAVFLVIAIITPAILAVIVPIGVVYISVIKFYLPCARQLNRTEAVKRSPIFNLFSETITGASVIRAFNCSDRFVQELHKRVDENIKFYFASNTAARWVGLWLELLGNLVAVVATIFTLVSTNLNGAEAGLSISYAIQITTSLQLVVLAVGEMEMNLVSVERVAEYTTLTPEASWTNACFKTPAYWPASGNIELRNYMTRYRDGLELVLRGINCVIHPGEKIGIVGRTGAGKSSLTLSLFRLIESTSGAIYIDDINIADMGLHDLRSKLTILPQEPVLFSGSLRSNVDPSWQYSDDMIWYALQCAHLKDFSLGLENGLEFECGEAGQNLSMGQRQLVCLARALLHKSRVLILDEVTSAVDMETDELIQDTIRTHFKECTVLTIAHRLNTVIDCDRVLVMDVGIIKEFDTPQNLLLDEHGVFYHMAKQSGLI